MAKGGGSNIRKPPKNKGPRFSSDSTPDYGKMPTVFSLERIQNCKYCFSKLEKEDKAAFSESIFRRKDMSWVDLIGASRKALGTEKISIKSIKSGLPSFITDESESLVAFRFNGNKAMVGYKKQNIFYVLWFDHDFTLYDHGP